MGIDLENLPFSFEPFRYYCDYHYYYREDFVLESIRLRFRNEPVRSLSEALRTIEMLPRYKYLSGYHSCLLLTYSEFYGHYLDIRKLLYLISDYKTSEIYVNRELIPPTHYLEMENILIRRARRAGAL